MKRDEDRQLWDLLGQARPAEVSPFFARNVIRRIRERGQRPEWLRWLQAKTLIPATGLAVALVATMLLMQRPASLNPADDTPDVIAALDPQDYDIIADLDELMAADESNLWDDDAETL